MTETEEIVALLLDRKQVLTESGKVRRSWAATDLDRQAAALITAQAAQIAALEGERDESMDMLAGVLFTDPGWKLAAVMREARSFWTRHDATLAATPDRER